MRLKTALPSGFPSYKDDTRVRGPLLLGEGLGKNNDTIRINIDGERGHWVRSLNWEIPGWIWWKKGPIFTSRGSPNPLDFNLLHGNGHKPVNIYPLVLKFGGKVKWWKIKVNTLLDQHSMLIIIGNSTIPFPMVDNFIEFWCIFPWIIWEYRTCVDNNSPTI